LYTRDGRQVGRLDPVFKANLGVREVQIIQERLDEIRVRYVPTEQFNDEHARTIVRRLQDRLGPLQVIMEPMDKIPRTANGKFRAVLCRLPSECREQVKQDHHDAPNAS
jgi:phenylacetate-CoA ligase